MAEQPEFRLPSSASMGSLHTHAHPQHKSVESLSGHQAENSFGSTDSKKTAAGTPVTQTAGNSAGNSPGDKGDQPKKPAIRGTFSGLTSGVAESLRRARTTNPAKVSLHKNSSSHSMQKPNPIFAGFDMTKNNPNAPQGEEVETQVEDMMKFIWPEELRIKNDEENSGALSKIFGGPDSRIQTAQSHTSESLDNWRSLFDKETEESYHKFFSPINQKYWARLYINGFLLTSIFAVYYGVIPRFLEDVVDLVQYARCEPLGYLPCKGEQGIIYAVTAAICLASFIACNMDWYENYRSAIRFHTIYIVIFAIMLPLCIYFRSVFMPLGLMLLYALMLYGSICQPVWNLALIGLTATVLTIAAAFVQPINPLTVGQSPGLLDCTFLSCWYIPFSFGAMSLLGHITGIYYSYQAETFSKGVFVKNQEILEKHKKLKETKEISDQIALSILPKQVWEDLRHEKHQMFHGGFHQSLMYHHQSVSILYADIVGFTHFSSGVPAESLVWLLNSIFLDFDNLVETEQLEKIKTLGDCYVLCAGVPKASPDHALKIVKIGLEMVKRTTNIESTSGLVSLPIRVGIHSGSVMAGLIGDDKLIYDVWGQDVHIAAMMEKTSQPSRVHVSEATYNEISKFCRAENGPLVTMENPNVTIETYFIDSIIDESPSAAATISKASGPKKGKSSLTITTNMTARLSSFVEPMTPSAEKRLSLFRVFGKDDNGEVDEGRGRSFDGVALTDIPSKHDNVLASPQKAKANEERPKVIEKPSFLLKRLSGNENHKLEGDDLNMYSTTTSQIHPTFVTFRDPVVEQEYQWVYVSKMGSKFLSAMSIVFLCTLVQAAMIIIVSPTLFVWLTQILNLCFLFPIIIVSILRQQKLMPRLSYHIFQTMATLSVFVMFMSSFWGIVAVIVDQKGPQLLTPEQIQLMAYAIHQNILTSGFTSTVFTRLKSFNMLVLVIFLSVCLEGMTFAIRPSLNGQLYGEPFFHLTLILFALVIVQRRLDLFIRRNYLMKKVLVQNSFEIQDIEAKSRRFLRNLLPGPVVELLKENPEKTIAQSVPKAAVLFCCISNFETFDLPSMRILNEIVSKFDHLCVNYGVEKIKLIGNTYMAATGVSGEDEHYLTKLADFSLALRDKIADINKMFNKQFVLRIGIETGPLVAGVIGKKKFAFDIWGLTVNVASRMESTGVPDRIQITQNVYNLLKDRYQFERRGEVEVKGRGLMLTYFLKSKRRASLGTGMAADQIQEVEEPGPDSKPQPPAQPQPQN